MFSKTSAKFWSGNLPISSARITSTRLPASRFFMSAFSSDCLIPVTTTSSLGTSWADATDAIDKAEKPTVNISEARSLERDDNVRIDFFVS